VIDTGSAQKSCSDAVQKMASATLAAPPRATNYDTEVLKETLIHPCVNYVEYHCCEMRQLEHERIYAGMGLAPDWYIVGLQHDSVRSVLGFELISSSSSSKP